MWTTGCCDALLVTAAGETVETPDTADILKVLLTYQKLEKNLAKLTNTPLQVLDTRTSGECHDKRI